ncbi:MAG: FAD-binding protein [Gammaproteobacteria bacterium]
MFPRICNSRHTGGQQFERATIPLDTRQLNRVVSFDSTKGHIEVEAGIQWSELILYQQVIRSPEQSARSRRKDRVCLGRLAGNQRPRPRTPLPADHQ